MKSAFACGHVECTVPARPRLRDAGGTQGRPVLRARSSPALFALLSIALLAPPALIAGCGARSALDALVNAGDDDAGALGTASVIDAADEACGETHLGEVARVPVANHGVVGEVLGQVLDPDQDALVVLAFTDLGGGPTSLTAVDLATGALTPLANGGDGRVVLGTSASPVWDPKNHRVVVLGGSNDLEGTGGVDTSQVYAFRVQGAQAILSLLPDFPGSTTTDVPLPAVVDPASERLYVVQDKASTPGPVKTYALDLTEGHEAWSLVSSDAQSSLANVQMAALVLDAPNRRLLGLGGTFLSTTAPVSSGLWVLSLDHPSGWTALAGNVPPSVAEYTLGLARGLTLTPGADGCGYVTAFTDDACLYEAWRVDVGTGTFAMTSLGVAIQPPQRASRGPSLLDDKRQNFVFAGGAECIDTSTLSDSTDFVPLVR